MSERSRHVALSLLLAAGAALGGCGKKDKGADAPVARVERLRGEDVARCEAAGRDDRDVQEASVPGAVTPNIRRVYGYVGEGDDRRRVLLCREVDTNFDGIKDVVRTYGEQGEKLTEQADSDYDGFVDTWIQFAEGRPGKLELDGDADGLVEETRFYVGGKLSRVQRDTNGDRRVDVFEVYDGGELRRIGIDVDHDGQVDRWDRDELKAREEAAEEAKAAGEPGAADADGGGG